MTTTSELGGWRLALSVAVQVAFIAAVGVLIYTVFVPIRRVTPTAAGQEAPLPASLVSLDGAFVKGSKTARVAMIEFADVQCPYCVRFARDTLPALQKKYIDTGEMKLAFRHLPVLAHPLAPKAAEALECAGDQGQFWNLHDRLFAAPERIGRSDIAAHLREAGFDLAAFEACLDGSKAGIVRAHVEQARLLGIRGTPTFLLGNVQADGRVQVRAWLSGSKPLAVFEAAIQALAVSDGDLLSRK